MAVLDYLVSRELIENLNIAEVYCSVSSANIPAFSHQVATMCNLHATGPTPNSRGHPDWSKQGFLLHLFI